MAGAERGIDALFGQVTCSVEGCAKPLLARGWCATHYSRWRRHGDLSVNKRPPRGIHSCETCAVEFLRKPGGKGRFCSPQCTQAWNKETQSLPVGTRSRDPRKSVCLTCGAGFLAKRANRSRWCSRSCVKRYLYLECGSLNEMARLAGYKKGYSLSCTVSFRECVGCGGLFCVRLSNQIRCFKCRHAAIGPRPRLVKSCMDCSVSIVGTAARRLCHSCLRKRGRTARKPFRKHRLRARRFGVPYEPIKADAVFKAAKWRCALCGVRTLKSKRGSTHPRAPELDHIVPMSLGGPHMLDNVQLACRACNHSKGAKVLGQLSLFSCVGE